MLLLMYTLVGYDTEDSESAHAHWDVGSNVGSDRILADRTGKVKGEESLTRQSAAAALSPSTT